MIMNAREGSESQVANALEYLCETYWYPVYAYVRRRGHKGEDAQDITQAFLARMVHREIFQKADPTKGKLRAFMLNNLKFFLNNWRNKEIALKRGGGSKPLSINVEWAENRYQFEPVDDLTPDKLFDRRWALTLLEEVLKKLKDYYRDELAKEDLFQTLKPTICGGKTSKPYAVIAERFGVKENTIKAEVKRLRDRYIRRLEAAIGDTVGTEEEMDDEKQYLMSLFG